MHSPPPMQKDTPFSIPPAPTDEDIIPPATSGASLNEPDPLVVQTAQKLSDVINDFKRKAYKRESHWAPAHGRFELILETNQSQRYEIEIVADSNEDEDNVIPTITMRPRRVAGDRFTHHTSSALAYNSTRSESDRIPEKDLVSKKRRKPGVGEDTLNKRLRSEDNEDIISLITKKELDGLLSKLSEDVQDNTSECVNHLQSLLQRLKEEWHEKSKWDHEQQISKHQDNGTIRNSNTGNRATLNTAFPSPNVERDPDVSVSELIRQEAKLLSSQIKWVEECRRVAADSHDKREDTWRISSAGFHDRTRQDREDFQNRLLQESASHTQTLNQILNEVKAIGLYTQSMKWETPGSLSNHPTYSPIPTPPAQPAQPVTTGQGTSKGRGSLPSKQ